ncbi:hypothetical protein FKP32DRAFT_1687701 [Trametes sanguinea]|nr:hypothetical protein FKP32DRAFT_1687701 [Trametes sanguinea]
MTLAAFVEAAILILKIGKAALEICPVPGLSAVVDVLLALAKKVKVYETNQRTVGELIEQLQDLLAAFDTAALTARRCSSFGLPEAIRRTDIALETRKSPLEERIETLRIQLQIILDRAMDVRNGGTLQRLLRSAEYQRDIRRLRREVKRILVQFTCGSAQGQGADIYRGVAMLHETVEACPRRAQ